MASSASDVGNTVRDLRKKADLLHKEAEITDDMADRLERHLHEISKLTGHGGRRVTRNRGLIERIKTALKTGPMKVSEISRKLDIGVGSISGTLSVYKGKIFTHDPKTHTWTLK